MLVSLLVALPWIVVPLLLVRRVRRSVSIDHDLLDERLDVNSAPVQVSVVLPARNEQPHIEACMRSIMSTTWPNVELVVINDNSMDDTGEIARRVARENGNVKIIVIDAQPLPEGWFGKQWACHTGMQHASGTVLLFTDADTRHASTLISRSMQALSARRADLLSIAGHQDLRSFWEFAIQPIVFTLLLMRYGGTREIEGATQPFDVIANGQCLMITRAAYDVVGGHEAVRDFVAEDLMLAQRAVSAKLRVSFVIGRTQLSTRMYENFRTLSRGWLKNVYAGGRLAMRPGRLHALLFPVLLVGFPLLLAAPFFALMFVALDAASGHALRVPLLVWSATSSACTLLFFGAVHSYGRTGVWRALYAPIGAITFAGICAAAVWRGQRVEWKERKYTAA